MRPTLFEIPVLGSIPSYAALYMAAFLVCISLARREGERLGMSGRDLVDLGIVAVIAGVAGARLLAVLTDGQLMDFVHLCTDPARVPAKDALVSYCTADAECGAGYLCDASRHACHPVQDCLAALKFWRGGLTFYGGFLLAAPAVLLLARRRRMDLLRVADLGAPLVMLGEAIGKVGCFLNGCCYGAVTGAWCGVTIPGHTAKTHPTQLYESAAALALFALLYFVIRPRKRRDGEVFAWLLLLFGADRLVLELFRADPRGALGPLSTSQIISIPLVILGAWLLARLRRRGAHLATDT